MTAVQKNRMTLAIGAALTVITLLLYWPARHNQFVTFDDYDYIVDNPHVTAGLTWPGITWAFTTGHASNWHPLTWISHMTDCQLYGLNPAGHHLTNVLLHAINTVLVFVLLQIMTGSLWRSAFVAALFGWHPLHVESVAWASERKDVLSTLFWLLTMLAYVKYVHASQVKGPRSKVYYVLALLLFVLGLMSKPMVVTLPCALLLLDYWPLRRSEPENAGPHVGAQAVVFRWGWLALEKLPFFILAAIASVVTYLVQNRAGAMTSLETLPLSARLQNASLAYFQYLSKAIWPQHLAMFYPMDRHPALAAVVVSVVLLAAFSILFLVAGRRRPYLVTGWFWFIGTLVPTIGLVQVGSQSMADRYMYIPSIGLFVAIVWGLAELAALLEPARKMAAVGGAFALAGCLVATSLQLTDWRNSKVLYQHAIDVTDENYVAYNGLGGLLDDEHDVTGALTNFSMAVDINPRYPEGQYNLGTVYLRMGNLDAAAEHLAAAIRVDPKYAPAHNNMGEVQMKAGKPEDAAAEFRQAITLAPNFADAHYNFGTLLARQKQNTDAIREFRDAIRLKPNYAQAHGNLGITLMSAGDPEQGIAEFKEAARLEPGNAATHLNLAMALASRHQTSEAVAEYRATLRLEPNHAVALNNLAWLLACDPKAEPGNSKEAAELAQKSCELTGFKEFDPVLTLSAAQAGNGNFDEAISNARKAVDLAKAAHDPSREEKAAKLLQLFQSGQPYREN